MRHLVLVCIKSKLRRQDFFLIECRDNHKWKNSAHHKDDRRMGYANYFKICVSWHNFSLSAMCRCVHNRDFNLWYHWIYFLYFATILQQVLYICIFYVLSCTWIHMIIFISINYESTFSWRWNSRSICLPYQKCFE